MEAALSTFHNLQLLAVSATPTQLAGVNLVYPPDVAFGSLGWGVRKQAPSAVPARQTIVLYKLQSPDRSRETPTTAVSQHGLQISWPPAPLIGERAATRGRSAAEDGERYVVSKGTLSAMLCDR